jgi:uncharacterized protein (DUF697 family)
MCQKNMVRSLSKMFGFPIASERASLTAKLLGQAKREGILRETITLRFWYIGGPWVGSGKFRGHHGLHVEH